MWTHAANIKNLYNICTTSAQRLQRWAFIVQMLYNFFVYWRGDGRAENVTMTRLLFPDTIVDFCADKANHNHVIQFDWGWASRA